MDFYKTFSKIESLIEEPIYRWGFLLGGVGGAFWADHKYFQGYLEGLKTVTDHRELFYQNINFAGKSLDEILIGGLVGLVGGITLKKIIDVSSTRKRKNFVTQKSNKN